MATHQEQEIFMTTGEMIDTEARQAANILFAHKDEFSMDEWIERRAALDRGDYEAALRGL